MSTHEACVVERLKQCEEELQKSATACGSDMSHVPRVPRSTIKLASLLGKGGFSVVHKAKMNLPRNAPPSTTTTTNSFIKLPTSSKKPSSTYALKCLRHERIILPEEFVTAAMDLAHEAFILSQLHHQNIIRLEGIPSERLSQSYAQSSKSTSGRLGYYLILEVLKETLVSRLERWREGSALENAFGTQDNSIVTMYSRLRESMLGVAQAMKYLHQKNIVMRDLKPDNVGFGDDGTVKLFDFGFARRVDECVEGEIVGSYRYMDPDCMMGKKSDTSSDVYSFGVLLWEVATLDRPYQDLVRQNPTTTRTELRLMLSRKLSSKTDGLGWRPSVNQVPSSETRHLIEACWNPDPSLRPDFDAICEALKVLHQKHTERSVLKAKHRWQHLQYMRNRKPIAASSSLDTISCSMVTHKIGMIQKSLSTFRSIPCPFGQRSHSVQSGKELSRKILAKLPSYYSEDTTTSRATTCSKDSSISFSTQEEIDSTIQK